MPVSPTASPPRNSRATAHRVNRLDSGAIREKDWKCRATRGTVSTEAPRVAHRTDTKNRGALTSWRTSQRLDRLSSLSLRSIQPWMLSDTIRMPATAPKDS